MLTINKKIICITIYTFFSITSFAQNKLGHINTSDIIQSMPEYGKAKQDIKTLEDKLTTELNLMQQELQKKIEELNQLPENTAIIIKQKKENEISEMKGKINQAYEDSQNTLNKTATEKMQSISYSVKEAIKKVGQKEGFLYIIDIANNNLLYYSPTYSIDITTQVKSALGLK